MSQTYGAHAAAQLLSGNTITMSRHDAPLPAVPAAAGRNLPTDEELREISASLRGLRYGSVSIVVQDGVIIQIDRVEKRRLRNRRDAAENGR